MHKNCSNCLDANEILRCQYYYGQCFHVFFRFELKSRGFKSLEMNGNTFSYRLTRGVKYSFSRPIARLSNSIVMHREQ